VDDQRKHWWNGRWGQAARRDVYLRLHGGRWQVEQRAGGGDGVSQFYDVDSREEADDLVRQLLNTDDRWRELSPPRRP